MHNYRKLMVNLLLGVEKWAQDEDGIHPDVWEAYKEGREALGAKAIWTDGDAEFKFPTSLHADIAAAKKR